MVGKPPSVCFAKRLTNTDICCKLTGHAGHHENECGETWPPDNVEAIEEFIVKLRKSARKIEKEITEWEQRILWIRLEQAKERRALRIDAMKKALEARCTPVWEVAPDPQIFRHSDLLCIQMVHEGMIWLCLPEEKSELIPFYIRTGREVRLNPQFNYVKMDVKATLERWRAWCRQRKEAETQAEDTDSPTSARKKELLAKYKQITPIEGK